MNKIFILLFMRITGSLNHKYKCHNKIINTSIMIIILYHYITIHILSIKEKNK